MEYVENNARQQSHALESLSLARTVPLFIFSLITYIAAMHWRVGIELADDGAFFLRYAQNMLSGEFWVWNLGENPIWGASAPLYPLFLAAGLSIGLTPEHSIIYTGYLLAGLGLSSLVVVFSRKYGLAAGLAFLAFTSIDSELMYFSIGGLETPLTFSLICLAVWAVIESRTPWIIGLSAALLMINKLDLVPVGGLVLLAIWVREGKFPARAVLLAGAVAVAWYGFAWIYFGAPVPNSFLTKSLHQGNIPKLIDWTWFPTVVYLNGTHKWLLALTLPAIILNIRRNLPLLILLIGTLATHTTAYIIKYPFEPYNWYCMPSLLCLAILAALGISNLSALIGQKILLRCVAGASFLAAFIYFSLPPNLAMNDALRTFTGLFESDRAQAGRWVNEHTPKSFKVMTYWGNPAFYSQREVIDASFLNRKFEANNLVETYKPEIVILQADPHTNPMQPFYPITDSGYSVVKIFDKTFQNGMPYFFTVLARNDVLSQIDGASPPKDFLSLLSDKELGDTYGLIKVYDQSTLFIHPGENTPTKATLNTAKFKELFQEEKVSIKLSISPLLAADAIARGAGNVRVTLSSESETILDAVITSGTPYTKEIDLKDLDRIHITVDNNGSADSDWLLLSIK
ncbi:hypothetical protein [Pseudomonas nitroreducens]|uniref:hypothetical protein n=1 Tax=Pseudomonas nitroreducens TaxID=46680 RepID=UPI0020A094BB|nr:hypothetical protein [Pseudomonas nitroreducens]MCP1624161.1 hypothetical protein [Pseudomonas nitroreducens]